IDASPSKFLMPVAFSSLLGGMVTVIGTPPNLIVSNYREQVTDQPFEFFDFAPIGLILVVLGIGFTVAIGIRLIPKRKSQEDERLFEIGEYLSEVVVDKDSEMVGKKVRDLYELFKVEVEVLSIIRDKHDLIVPSANDMLLADDLLIIKTDSSELTDLVKRTGLTLKGAKIDDLQESQYLRSQEISLVEVVLREDSLLIGRTALEVKLRNRYNVNLVAVYSRGTLSISRLKDFRFEAGDILLLQAPTGILKGVYQKLSLLPLAGQSVDINMGNDKARQYLPLAMFVF